MLKIWINKIVFFFLSFLIVRVIVIRQKHYYSAVLLLQKKHALSLVCVYMWEWVCLRIFCSYERACVFDSYLKDKHILSPLQYKAKRNQKKKKTVENKKQVCELVWRGNMASDWLNDINTKKRSVVFFLFVWSKHQVRNKIKQKTQPLLFFIYFS